jgi:hypothetical protein
MAARITSGFRLAALATLAVLLLAGTVHAGEFYYLTVFAFQGEPNLPRSAHTFATFIRASGDGPCPENYRLEAHTISWYPAGGAIRAARLLPEPGVNLSLPATLCQARLLGARVSRWGPFQIHRELYDRALA